MTQAGWLQSPRASFPTTSQLAKGLVSPKQAPVWIVLRLLCGCRLWTAGAWSRQDWGAAGSGGARVTTGRAEGVPQGGSAGRKVGETGGGDCVGCATRQPTQTDGLAVGTTPHPTWAWARVSGVGTEAG